MFLSASFIWLGQKHIDEPKVVFWCIIGFWFFFLFPLYRVGAGMKKITPELLEE